MYQDTRYCPTTLTILNESSYPLLLSEISSDDVYRNNKQIKNDITSGHGELLRYVLIRNCASIVCSSLAKIFNLVISTDTFPDLWNITEVILVFKKGDC